MSSTQQVLRHSPRSALPFLTSIILWIGDLNYRISELDVDSVKELIGKRDFETLLNYDQVRVRRAQSPAAVQRSACPAVTLVRVEALSSSVHVLPSSRGKSMRKLCLSALWRERSISSPPTSTTPALTSGIRGNFSRRPSGGKKKPGA